MMGSVAVLVCVFLVTRFLQQLLQYPCTPVQLYCTHLQQVLQYTAPSSTQAVASSSPAPQLQQLRQLRWNTRSAERETFSASNTEPPHRPHPAPAPRGLSSARAGRVGVAGDWTPPSTQAAPAPL